MKSLYRIVFDGDWVEPSDPNDYRLACCDCGAVHKLRFEINDHRINMEKHRLTIRFEKDYRATGQRRRQMKRRKEGLWTGKTRRRLAG